MQAGEPGERLHFLDRAVVRPRLERGDRGLQPRHRLTCAAELVEVLRDQIFDVQGAPVRRAELRTRQRHRLLQRRLRAVGMAAAALEIADEGENLDVQFGQGDEIAVGALAPAREQLFGGLGAAGAGRGAVEQALEERFDRVRAPRFALGKASLRLCVERGAVGQARLTQTDRGRAEQNRRGRRADRDRERMPLREREQPIGERVRPRLQRAAAEVAFDVFAQSRDGRITQHRLRPGRFAHDRVQVGAELSPQRGGVERSRFGVVAEGARLAAGQQFGQQHAERVHVDRGRRGVAVELFGGGIGAGQAPRFGMRALAVAGQQLGDAEIDELDAAVVADEHVARLQVAVHDQIAVRVLDRTADVDEQRQALARAQALAFAMRKKIVAADEFEGEKRRPGRRESGIEQLRDVRVLQPRQDALLAQKTPALVRSVHVDAQQLQCDGLRAAGQFALGLEHAGHAAGADEAAHAIAGDGRCGIGGAAGKLGQPLRDAALQRIEIRRVAEGLADERAQGRVRAVAAQPVLALVGGHLEQVVEQRFDFVPALGEFDGHRRGLSPCIFLG